MWSTLAGAAALWLASRSGAAAQGSFQFTTPEPFSCEVHGIDLPDREGLDALRDGLARDAFAEAYGVFLRDLDDARRQAQDLIARFDRWHDQTCRPIVDELFGYLAAVRDAVQSGCQGEIPEQEFSRCLALKNQLDARLAQIQAREPAVLEQRRVLEGERAELEPLVRRAMTNAKNLLDPQNVEEVFHLYIFWAVELDKATPSRDRDSCRTFARMAKALGRRVLNQRIFIDLLVRSVVERHHFPVSRWTGDPPLAPVKEWGTEFGRSTEAFNAKGFKKQFYDNIAENQVRHAAGFMRGGYAYGGTVAQLGSYIGDLVGREIRGRPAEEGDYRLAIEAAQMGFQLKAGRLHAGDFGAAIETRLCE